LLTQVHTSGLVVLIGYSQGAICASHFWRDVILNPNGACHNRVNDVIAAITWGNPCRAPGVANGNVFEVLIDAVRVCSLGQITDALFEVGGQYRRNM